VVLGFPCNQFANQEPGTNAEIAEFAARNYGVTFPMFAKVEVNGPGACELYTWLTAALPKEDGSPDVAWNFTKFIIGRDGSPLRRFEPMTTPEEIGTVLESLL
jgi:glutathione peroxidase